MKIIKVLKGFVTNSSSSNYWLDDGVLEPGETGYTKQSTTIQNINPPVDQNKIQKETFWSFLIWLGFSLILLITYFIKKIKK